jgi:hypothetical protein
MRLTFERNWGQILGKARLETEAAVPPRSCVERDNQRPAGCTGTVADHTCAHASLLKECAGTNTECMERMEADAGCVSVVELPSRHRAMEILQSIFDVPMRQFFGRDLFVSYSRADATDYVQELALRAHEDVEKGSAVEWRLGKRRLSYYLDRLLAPPTAELPSSLRRQLRWSSILVVVCTKNAAISPHVAAEVLEFVRLGRSVVPIDVGGHLAVLLRRLPRAGAALRGASPELEDTHAVSPQSQGSCRLS